MALALLAGLWVRWAFPPERLRQLTVARLEAALRRPVQIEELSFHLLRGIEARGVQVGPSVRGGLPLFRADRVLLTYDLSALYWRRLKITHIRIDAPRLSLRQGSDGRLDIEDLLTPPPASGHVAPDPAVSQLPLLLQLDLVEVQKISLFVTSERDRRWLRLNGLDAEVSHVALPSWDRATLSARVSGHPLTLETGDLSGTLPAASLNLQFDLNVHLKDSASLQVDGDGSASSRVRGRETQRIVSLPDARFHVTARARLDSGRAEVQDLRASLGRAVALSVRGQVRDLKRRPEFDLTVTEGRIDLGEVWATVQALIHGGVLSDLSAEIRGMSLSGKVDLKGTGLRGTWGTLSNDAALDTHMALSDFQLALPSKSLSISHASLSGRLSVAADSTGVKTAHLSVDSLRVPALRLTLNDTTRAALEGLSFEGRADYDAGAHQMKAKAKVGLARAGLVAGTREAVAKGMGTSITVEGAGREGYRGQVEGRIASLFRGEVGLGLSASISDTTPQGGPDWTKVRCQGRLTWAGLDLGQVPDAGAQGRADLSADVRAEGMEDLWVGLDVKASALRLGPADSARSLPPIRLTADLKGGVTPDGKGFYIRRMASEINEKTADRAVGRDRMGATGWVEISGSVADGGLKIDLHRAEVDVGRAASLLEGALGPLGGTASGTVGLSGGLTASQGWNGPIRGDLRLRLKGLRADLPGLRLTVEGVEGAGSATLRPDSLSLGVALKAGRVVKSGVEVLKDGLRNLGLSAEIRCATTDPGGVLRALTTGGRVDVMAQAEATLPEVGGRLKAHGHLSDLFHRAFAEVRAEASLSPSDSLSWGGLKVAGSVGADVRVGYDGETRRAHVDGRLSLGHLRLRSESALVLDDLHGVVPFSQGIDLAGRRLVRETEGGRPTSGAVPYAYVRAYYDRSKEQGPGLSLSRIEVRDVRTGGLYRAEDVEVHLIVRDGALTMPHFSMKAYEGEVAGSLRLDFGEGDPTGSDLSGLRYEADVQVSHLNASLLTDRGERDRGDATVSADVHLRGNGLPDYRDAFGPFEVSGACHLTRIGPAAADHLLRQIDSDEADVDVQYYRRLIRQGWNFRSLAVELRHGFAYVSGQLIKPKWMPFNIPASQISRVPIRYLLTPAVREEDAP
ncbi:MAG: hypothetical protein A3F84_28815 [Candidatus Handelsmanbacteria bacterium RIFCSPLOWO2_12_FULL_64_10]|uniref:AsmA-like C-terminal domain-containing protein n=1 Tax=Handelsmanbacteria sp. (strain RIFCSPLOWO2_12_FULL_64_10) TaxID=1817868 RepID=A0A1F6D3S8_HANXR|nr:MAG: hypothetical protein A3F84_28815 [Candidatus Handelsmanbacteria bacterium RIFCSPLOWO2_12_FULL_64_10]